MKKIFNIAALALMSAFVLTSCVEKEMVTYHPDEVVIPALQELSVEEGLQLSDGATFATLQFSAADFGLATAARYTAYADIKEDFSSKQALGNVTTDTAGIAISAATLNNALITLGCPDSVDVKVYFRIETQMMGESSPVERVEALVSNSVSAVVKPFDAEKVYPSVYVVGSITNPTWNHDAAYHLFSYAEDEENYVGVLDMGENFATAEFKITGAANYENETGNWGLATSSATDPDAASVTLENGSGTNISQYRAHRYYNFHFVKSSLTLNMIKGFDEVVVAGDFGDWMEGTPASMQWISSNGKFYADIQISAAGGFKFVIDGGTWIGTGDGEGKLNIGGGDNIQIAEPGNYRFYLDLNDWENPTYSLSAADYGTPVDGGGSDTPDEPEDPEDPEDPDEPVEPVEPSGWGVKGDFDGDTGWANEYAMTEFPAGSGIYVSSAINFAEGNQFKIQYNKWETEIAATTEGDTLSTGVAYSSPGKGSNFAVSASQAGLRKIVLNTNDNTVYILGWGVIGAIAGDSWGNDLPMLYDEGTNTWTSAVPVQVEGGFKLRWAGQWSTSEVTVPDRGLAEGASFAVGSPISLVQGGGNIDPSDATGSYNMVYDVANETLTLTAAE